jgi:catechol 2,3-dioxygenase-like lactoylglutathione lyase family enzyme
VVTRKGTAIGAQLTIERTNTVLYCERWEATVAFYQSVLGLTVAFRNDWFVEFQLTMSSFLSIADSARATLHSVDGQGVTLTWRVPDLVEVRRLLAASGIEVGEIQRRWGADVFYCHDPEGHRIELWSDRM